MLRNLRAITVAGAIAVLGASTAGAALAQDA